MRANRRILAVIGVMALVVLGLAVPGAAKRGGIPGAPSGSDLDVTMDVSAFAWANSEGDVIPFEIIVTNEGSGDLVINSVKFEGAEILSPDTVVEQNASWTTTHGYIVTPDDLAGLTFQESSEMTKTVTVTATLAGDELEESATATATATATTTAHPIDSCKWSVDPNSGTISVGPGTEYTVCSDEFSGADYWKLETTLVPPRNDKGRGKLQAPFLTVRDGVPGNWCMDMPDYRDKQTGWATTTGGVQFVYFPSDGLSRGPCFGGGAGGDTIPTRNSTLFYMAYRESIVTATPCPNGVSLDLNSNRLVCNNS